MSNGMIHIQQSFREIVRALNKFRIQETECLIAPEWSKIVPLCDVSAAKNQLPTNQNLFNARANSRNDRWTCIIPLDMYRVVPIRPECVNAKLMLPGA